MRRLTFILEDLEIADLDDGIFLSEGILETPLRYPPGKRHLAALKSRALSAPARARCPLCPLVAVLPWPEPGPLPILFRSFFEPSWGLRSSSFILSYILQHFDQMDHLLHHAPRISGVFLHVLSSIESLESQALDRSLLSVGAPDGALRPLYLQVRHVMPPLSSPFPSASPSPRTASAWRGPEGGLDHVVGIPRPVTFRVDVPDAGHLDDSPNRAAGDNARAFEGGLDKDLARTVDAGDLVRHRASVQGDLYDALSSPVQPPF